MTKIRQRKPKSPQIGNIKTQAEITSIDNPHYTSAHSGEPWNPKKINAYINVRESSIVNMEVKGLLGTHQVLAAHKFRRLWESAGGAGAGAMDYAREPVDGGGITDPISLRQLEAGTKLDECRKVIGWRAYDIVRKVAGEGYAISELSVTHRERTTNADYLKHALDDLAYHWGYTTVKNPKESA